MTDERNDEIRLRLDAAKRYPFDSWASAYADDVAYLQASREDDGEREEADIAEDGWEQAEELGAELQVENGRLRDALKAHLTWGQFQYEERLRLGEG